MLCTAKSPSSEWLKQAWSLEARVAVAQHEVAELGHRLAAGEDPAAADTARQQLRQCRSVLKLQESLAKLARSCHRARERSDERFDLRPRTLHLEPFDLAVTVVEDYEKPFREFIAGVFADETLRTGLAGTLTAHLDPVARAAASELEATQRRQLLDSYDNALVGALKADIDLQSANLDSPEARKAAIDLRLAKVRANRLADQLGVARPFPDSGVRL